MTNFLNAVALAALLSVGSTAAFAGSCPKHMKAIDAALSGQTSLSAADLAEVKKLRAEGEAQHKSGQHKESVVSLMKAKKMLGIE